MVASGISFNGQLESILIRVVTKFVNIIVDVV